MHFSVFREHINRFASVKDYLKAANRAGRGWRIASWYTAGFIVTVIAYFIILIYALSFLKIPAFLNMQAIGLSALAVVIVVPLTICFVYCGALLRQITLRWGYNSDILVFTLAVIVSLVLILWPTLSVGGYFAEGLGTSVLLSFKKQIEQNGDQPGIMKLSDISSCQ